MFQNLKIPILATFIIMALFIFQSYEIINLSSKDEYSKNMFELLEYEGKIRKALDKNETLPISLTYRYGVFDLKEKQVVSNLDARPSDLKFITRQENGHLFYKTYFRADGEFYYLVLAKKQNAARILFVAALTLAFALVVVFFALYLSFVSGIKPYKDAKKYMNNFFNDAMHELKTPLGVIGINLEMLGLDNKYVTRMRSALKQMQVTYEDTEYYINDAGNQIELLGTSIALRARELAGEDVSYPEKYYRGEYIDEIIPLARAEFGDEIFRDESRVLILAEFAKDEVLKIIQKDLADAGIHIQNWASEKSLYGELEPTIKKLERSGKMYEAEGKIWIRSSQLGDEKDRVVIREDARPTYLAGDIVYHNNKFERGYERCINIWGADHHGYIARLKAAVHFLGYDESRLEIILMQMVNLLKDGQTYKMSKRAGNAILMSDVLAAIGRDAMRFIFISKKGETPLEFDVDELAREDSSNPIFYINYAHARVNQIFTKAGKREANVLGADFGALDEVGLSLAFQALSLNEILNDAFNSRGLQKLPDFLKALAAGFHKYYNENRVVGSENEDELLKLFAVVALSIKTALGLMGIAAKDKM